MYEMFRNKSNKVYIKGMILSSRYFCFSKQTKQVTLKILWILSWSVYNKESFINDLQVIYLLRKLFVYTMILYKDTKTYIHLYYFI